MLKKKKQALQSVRGSQWSISPKTYAVPVYLYRKMCPNTNAVPESPTQPIPLHYPRVEHQGNKHARSCQAQGERTHDNNTFPCSILVQTIKSCTQLAPFPLSPWRTGQHIPSQRHRPPSPRRGSTPCRSVRRRRPT